jgi:hypothetical protein
VYVRPARTGQSIREASSQPREDSYRARRAAQDRFGGSWGRCLVASQRDELLTMAQVLAMGGDKPDGYLLAVPKAADRSTWEQAFTEARYRARDALGAEAPASGRAVCVARLP